MSRRVQAKGARPTQLVRRALVPLRGPRVVGGYADVATRVGRAPGITLPLSRRAEALSTARTLTSSSFQRRGPAHDAQAIRCATSLWGDRTARMAMCGRLSG
jgi:hypothetical protein